MGLKDARRKKGLNQKEVAAALGVSQPTVSDWEAGRKMPTRKHLLRLSELLSVGADELLGVEGVHPLSDDAVKFALFGAKEVDDELLEEVRRFAQFAKRKRDEETR